MNCRFSEVLIKKAVKYLRSRDKVLSNLIDKYGLCNFGWVGGDPFHILVSSIIGQQLSAPAARAIRQRLLFSLKNEFFTPGNIGKLSPKHGRAAGLSRSKIGYLRGVTEAVACGRLDINELADFSDEEAISRLVEFKGIGRWTAEMFLIFGLRRLDVLSTTDAGLRRAIKISYHLNQLPSQKLMLTISEPWRPYRSIASWYLWRVVD